MDWIAKSFYGIGGQKIMDAVCKDQDEESSKAKSVSKSKRCNFSAAVKRNLNIAQRDKLEKLRLFFLLIFTNCTHRGLEFPKGCTEG